MGLAKIIAVIVIIVAIIAVACMYFDIDPIAMISNAVTGAVNWFAGLSDTAKGLYLSTTAALGGGVAWLKTKLNFSSFKKQTAATNAEVTQKMDALQQISAQKDVAIENLTVQKQSAEAKVQELESEYANYKTVLEGKDAQIERLQSQIDGLSKQNVDKLAEDVATKVTENTRKS